MKILQNGLLFLGLVLSLAGDLRANETPEQRFAARRDKFSIVEKAKLMVENDLLPQGGLKNPAVIDVMKRVPRHRFVPPLHQSIAFRDQAIAIGNAQTISPPYIVAYMTEQLDPKPGDKVLEIGTGSGYQAAVLSLLVDQVYSIEIVEPLGLRAEKTLQTLGMDNVHVKVGDGYKGWPEAAPFDSIIVTCSPESVPQPLIDQLREGGRMIIPIGERYQQSFYLCKKTNGKLEKERLTQALFVPMTGEAEDKREVQPDPNNPSLIGGGFEEVRDNGTPIGWHYARSVRI
jgi:protein-L-isoaspartate(D-aspartate) O-methyltransferase